MTTITAPARLVALTVHAWVALLAFDLARLAGFARVHERLRRAGVHRPATHVPYADVVWAVEEACVWYPRRAACLQRSVVTAWLLRRHGIAADLVIGYRPVPFESHAWVEVAGTVVNDRPQFRRVFTVLDRL